MTQRTVRVAVYTRQSILADDKDFGSLQAQREAVESYVKSQPAWTVLPEKYDDGGHSGGTCDRPGFQKLLQDVAAGDVDAVAVYKLDRLSRSISDFVRVMDLFERHGVRFISTTQAFDTSTSVGRMTVNLLATFATFEREMIAERTRDKMGAARRRGMFTGGPPPVGYRIQNKHLVIDPGEAETVLGIFRLYRDLGSTLAVAEEANRRGWRTRTGRRLDRNNIHRLLVNPTYCGMVRHDGQLYAGAHEPIVDEDLWAAVQHELKSNGRNGRVRTPSKSGALLAGLLRCGACGTAMTIHHSSRNGRRYASYVCGKYQREGASRCPGSRVSVSDLEAFVVRRIADIGRDSRLIGKTIEAAKRLVLKRKPELEKERKRLEQAQEKLLTQRRNLLDAVAGNGSRSRGVFEKLGEVEAELDRLAKSVEQARAELAALETGVIDEGDLQAALGEFNEVWSKLHSEEKARILQLLIEQVTFNAQAGEVQITLRPGGIRMLAQDKERETA